MTSFFITEKAANRLKEISDDEGIGHYTARVKVLGGGCSGMQNDLCFDEIIKDTDEVFEMDGVKIVIDFLSIQYLDGTSLDFVDSEFGAGFKFLNPNVKGTCGCGSSFSV